MTWTLTEIQKRTGDAQIVFVLLLSLARQRHDVTLPDVVRAAAVELDNAMAAALLALATHVAGGSATSGTESRRACWTLLSSSIAVGTNVRGEPDAGLHFTERLTLYRALVAAIKRLFSTPLDAGKTAHDVRVLAVQSD